jgi:hypothetical protein
MLLRDSLLVFLVWKSLNDSTVLEYESSVDCQLHKTQCAERGACENTEKMGFVWFLASEASKMKRQRTEYPSVVAAEKHTHKFID